MKQLDWVMMFGDIENVFWIILVNLIWNLRFEFYDVNVTLLVVIGFDMSIVLFFWLLKIDLACKLNIFVN